MVVIRNVPIVKLALVHIGLIKKGGVPVQFSLPLLPAVLDVAIQSVFFKPFEVQAVIEILVV